MGRKILTLDAFALTSTIFLFLSPAPTHAANHVPVTFNKDIAPLVYTHCTPCHHSGGIAPFPLGTFGEVHRHRTEILTATASRYMPPWPPQPGYGDFEDDRHLTPSQINLFAQWRDSGFPEGDPRDKSAPPSFPSEWQMGTPDLVVRMPQPFRIPKDGSDVFRNFIIPTNLKEPRFVNGIELRMNNTQVVHHANIILDRNNSLRSRDGKDGQPGFAGMDVITEASADSFDPDSHFLFWKPGTVLHRASDALSWRLDPGTDLVVNLHLRPTGKPESIQAEIGLYFAKTQPTKFPILVQLENDGAIDIPPGSSSFSVTDHLTIPVDTRLLAIYPHAHYLGKLIEAWAIRPDKQKLWLIRIPDWDINWQAVYEYRRPVFLPAGTTVFMRIAYDNSQANIRNPHTPPIRVRYGDRSEDEMGHVWLQLLPEASQSQHDRSSDARLPIQQAVMQRRLQKYPADFVAHYNLAALFQLSGKLDQAIASYGQALRSEPDSLTAGNGLAAALMQNNQVDKAIPLLESVLRNDPDYPNARYNLARALAVEGDLQGSAAAFQAFLVRQPDDAEAQAGLGTVLAKLHRYDEALLHLREAARLNPDDADLLTNLGSVLAIEGKLPEAINAFEGALRLVPGHSVARANLERARTRLAADPR